MVTVEIGGYTIQFYHKLEQPFRSYCHKNLGIFVYSTMGGLQLLYTKWVSHSFSMEGCKYSNTYNFSLSTAFNISEISFPNLELSAYKTMLPQQVIEISHTHDENALLELALEVRALQSPFADQATRRIVWTEKECECEELHFRRGYH